MVGPLAVRSAPMAKLTGTFSQTFDLNCDIATAQAHFADVATIAKNYGPLESHEVIGPHSLRLVLPLQNHGITTFQPRYDCTWSFPNDRETAWDTTPGSGNMVSVGTARFTETPSGCRMAWDSTITIDMPVNRFLAKGLQPVVSRMVAAEMKAYVQRMFAAL